MPSPSLVQDFMRLFRGRTDAYGTGRGQWIKREPKPAVYAEHLAGSGPGLGIAPLLDDGTVWFAAIDLDEPDFDAAREMQELLGFATTWIERSRSGNAHVWCFFSAPIEAWLVRGILRDTTAAIGKPTVEVFPKQDKLLEGMVGNYINLPYHGDDRPVLAPVLDGGFLTSPQRSWVPLAPMPLAVFLERALESLNDPAEWHKRGRWLMLAPPEQRTATRQESGTGKELHKCAEWIIANRDENPVMEGHRNAVYFSLAKQLLHWEACTDEEAWDMMCLVRDSADAQGVEHVPDSELRRIFTNAQRGGFTSTGCDDPLMAPYVHPECPIAHPELR